MKKTLLLLFILSTINIYSQITVTATVVNPSCFFENGTVTITAVGGIAPYTFAFALSGNPSNNPTVSPSGTYTIANLVQGVYDVVVTDSNQASSAITFIITNPTQMNAIVTATTTVSCFGAADGSLSVTATGGVPPYAYSYTLIGGSSSAPSSSNTFNGLTSGNYEVRIDDANGCILQLVYTMTQPVELVATYDVFGQDIFVFPTGGTSPYQYSLDSGPFQSSNSFSNLQTGNYTIDVKDANNCTFTLVSIVNVPAPLFNGNNTPVSIAPPSGSTLADIVLAGNNIRWYGAAVGFRGTANRRNNQTSELPSNTVIVYGTTYYASQTVNGFESQLRLAVTAVNPSLSNENFTLRELKYFPNPVQNTFTVSNSKIIDTITITDIYGKIIVSKKINSLNSEIDLSGLLTGMYFAKINSENQEKVIKIIKE